MLTLEISQNTSVFQVFAIPVFKCSPFAFQKGPFEAAKGLLLQCKTNPFGRQKDSFLKTVV